MNRPLACAAAVGVLLLAGCGTRGGPGPMPGHGASGRPPVGRVTGRLLLEGGPVRPGGRPPGPGAPASSRCACRQATTGFLADHRRS
jgi:hypothetical protein